MKGLNFSEGVFPYIKLRRVKRGHEWGENSMVSYAHSEESPFVVSGAVVFLLPFCFRVKYPIVGPWFLHFPCLRWSRGGKSWPNPPTWPESKPVQPTNLAWIQPVFCSSINISNPINKGSTTDLSPCTCHPNHQPGLDGLFYFNPLPHPNSIWEFKVRVDTSKFQFNKQLGGFWARWSTQDLNRSITLALPMNTK